MSISKNIGEQNLQEKDEQARSHERDALLAIAVFLVVFGVAVCMAAFLTATFRGQVTNLLSGAVMMLCSLMAWLRWRNLKKRS